MNTKQDECKANGAEEIKMWFRNELEILELYERGNTISRCESEYYLQQYLHKFKWPAKSRVLEIGSGDGSVTRILSKHIPADSELIGSDINEKAVEFANRKYANERIKFIPFNVAGDVPDEMKGQFDHVFSFYVFHWEKNHEKAFTNIYNILSKNGEFFSIFLARMDVFKVFEILSRKNKWKQWMKNIDTYVSPYYDFKDPDIHLSNRLKKIGFEVLDVKCSQTYFVHDSIDVYRSLITAVNGFDIPKHLWSEFLDEFIEVKRYFNDIDEKGAVKTYYNLMVLHCTKN